MSARVLRDFRRQTARAAELAAVKVQPAIHAAMSNEQLTRNRVAELEMKLEVARKGLWSAVEGIGTVNAEFRARSFLGRLKWLFLGR